MTQSFPLQAYDLAATLNSGQAFRWQPESPSGLGQFHHRPLGPQSPQSPSQLSPDSSVWIGVILNHWVCLFSQGPWLHALTARTVSDWSWLSDYLQLDLDLPQVLQTFPDDAPMQAAVASCEGLRLLRQDPWECLASFILSSTKQIVQIRQIVSRLCERFGEPLAVPDGYHSAFAFPSPQRLAVASESDLRSCNMGFRAPYLLATAREVASGRFDLKALARMPVSCARAELMTLPGVGRKIADCVLLFAYGFQEAFPVDVWVMKALRQLYFPGKKVSPHRLHEFAATHFGPYAGYAQQYIFHYIRTKANHLNRGRVT